MRRVNIHKIKAIKSNFLRGFILVLFIILTFLCSYADFSYDSGKEPFEFVSLSIPSYFLSKNSLYYYYENKKKDRLLVVSSYLSGRFGRFQMDAPLLIYKKKSYAFALGYQVTNDAIFFLNSIPFVGARGAKYFSSWGVMGYTGASANANDLALFLSNSGEYSLSGLLVKKQIMDYTSAQIGIHKFSMTLPEKEKNSIQTFSIASSPFEGINAKIALARDSRGRKIFNKDTSAVQWSGSYSRGKIAFNSFGEKWGKNFGPSLLFNNSQGRSTNNTYFSYRFSRNLNTYISYQDFQYDNPFILNNNIKTNQFSTDLNWRINKNISASLGIRTQKDINDLTSKDILRYKRNEINSSLTWKNKKIMISAEIKRYKERNFLSNSTNRSNSQRLNLNYFLNPNQQIGITYDNDHYFNELIEGSARNNRFGFTYRGSFPNNRGEFGFSYNQAENYDPVLGMPTRTRGESAEIDYWLTRIMKISGRFYRSFIPGRISGINSFKASIRYILSKHSDIEASYFSNPYESIYYLQDRQLKLKNVITLQLRQSFGGELEKGLNSRWNGIIAAQIYYFPKGNKDKITPLKHDFPAVFVNLQRKDFKERKISSDGQSIVFFNNVEPGIYDLSLNLNKLDSHFKLIDKDKRVVHLGPGKEKKVNFILESSSSLYVVVWNDVKGKGELTTFYTGFEGIGVVLDDKKTLKTNSDGLVIFKDLVPGKHKLAIELKSIPKGIIFTGKKEIEVNLPVGKETVSLFGLQGWGKVIGKVYFIPINKTTNEKKVKNNVEILIKNKIVGKTDKAGFYNIKVPAGNQVLSVNPDSVSANTYIVGKEKYDIKIEPSLELTKNFTLAFFGRVQGRIYEVIKGKTVPLNKGGMVINYSGDPSYAYTNKKGFFRFDKQKMGAYMITIDKDYIPKGYKLISPAKVPINIKSGEVRKIKILLQKY